MREFDYLDKTLGVSFNKNEDLYQFYKEKDKSIYYKQGQKPENTDELFYKQLLSDGGDEQELKLFIKEILSQEANYIDELELLVTYVQSALAYDWDAFNTKGNVTKYPYETYYLGKGICGDKSILLAKCLSLLNYDFALFVFNRANHMAVGIKVPKRYGNYGTDYAYIETTGITPIGYVPEKFINNIVLENTPKVIKFEGGKVFNEFPRIKWRYQELQQKYGKHILQFSAKKYVIELELLNKKRKLDSLKIAFQPYEGETLNNAKDYKIAKRIQIDLNNAVNEYNDMVKKFNNE